MRLRRRVGVVSAGVVWVCVSACALLDGGTPSATGTPYNVTETLGTDTCGTQSDGVQSVTSYGVQLAVNPVSGLATWAVGSSGSSSSGTFDQASRSFQFTDDQTTQIRAALPAYGLAACVMRRLDVISGVLANPVDAGTADASTNDAGDAGVTYGAFTATETITVGPVAGADCSDQIGVTDGQYLALPCQQSFAITGAIAATDQ